MDVLMHHCKECNRLIASDATRHLCDVCYAQYDLDMGLVEDAIHIHGQDKPSQVAAHTHLPIERVKVLLQHAKVLAQNLESDELCTNCGKYNSLAKSEYCLRCQLALYKSLGDEASEAALNQGNAYAKPDTSLRSLRDALDEKRQRTGKDRFRPTPPSVKGR